MKKIIFSIATLSMVMSSCFSDDDSSVDQGITGSTISGGTDNAYSFCVGDETEELDDIIIVSEGSGENNTFIIRNGDGEIISVPSTVDAFPSFDNEEVAEYSITHINYENDIDGIDVGDVVEDIAGIFVLSNAITVNTEDCREIAAAIFARESDDEDVVVDKNYVFCVDGLEDRATDIVVSFEGIGETGQIVITDEVGNILGLPDAFEGPEFDEAGVGVCYIRYINYNGDIEGLTGPDEDGVPTSNVSDLVGDFILSDFIMVTREDCSPTVVATTLTAGDSAPDGEYTFSVGDGTINNVTDLVIDLGKGDGEFVITDDSGTILGLPGADVGVVDFDTQGAGICYIRYINYVGTVEGLAATNSVDDLVGEFKISNFIVVNRIEEEETE